MNLDLGLGYGFLEMTPKVEMTKEKVGKSILSRFKAFVALKSEKQLTEWENMC
jgi:hypothetical protein